MITHNAKLARFNMVQQQIRPWEVLDSRVLEVLETVPREAFLPAAYRGLAYADIEVPIGQGQRMAHPRVDGRLLQSLGVQKGERVLEVGVGGGYLTACLVALGAQVTGVEIDAVLLEQARANLAAQRITGVDLICADALAAPVGRGPYDAILVGGALAVRSEELERQLKVGGRLVAVIGEPPARTATRVSRVGEAQWLAEGLFETDMGPLVDNRRREAFVF